MTTHLVIGDPHANPNHNNSRFGLLGKLIVDRQPDVIINIGDMGSMDSLSTYDKGKKSFEGRRYKKDVASVIDAQNQMFAPIIAYNKHQRELKQKQYKPRYILTLGNHENRINRAVESQAELEGVISVDDLKYKDFGWEVHDFLDIVIVDGVAYSHYFISGVMGRAIGGEHPAYSMLRTNFMSSTAGHSHLRDYCERTNSRGRKIQGLVAGCFLDDDQHEDYAGNANELWWKGLVIKHEVKDGTYEPEFISMSQIRKKYA